MTLLTPNFAGLQNGAAGPHVLANHEPTREAPLLSQPAGTGPETQPPPVAAPTPQPLKIALIGTAPSSRMLAPFNDPSWTIWACSPGNMNALPRVDVWFELHSNLLWPEHAAYGVPYLEWLNKQAFPIYMQDNSLVPRAMAYPKDQMVEQFGDYFFTSSFTWMMAFAMSSGAAEIALYGIDMASRDEYIRQRPGFFFFKHLAERRGVKITAPHESDIMQAPALYAYVDSTPFGRKIMARRAEVNGRVAQFDQTIVQATNNKNYLQGALEDIDYFESIWSGVCNDMGRLQHKNTQLNAENDALKARVAALMAPKIELEPVSSTFTIVSNAMPVAPPPRRRGRANGKSL